MGLYIPAGKICGFGEKGLIMVCVNKYIWVVVIVVVLLLVLVLSFWYFNPKVIFQRKFHFELPKTVEIINKSYSVYYDSLEIKIKFDENDYQTIKDGFKAYTDNFLREVDMKDEEDSLVISTFLRWWDKEKENAILAYDALIQGRWGAKTRTVAVLITQNNEGEYFLHIHY